MTDTYPRAKFSDIVSDGGMDPRDEKLLAEAKELDEAYAIISEIGGYDRDLVALVEAAKAVLNNRDPSLAAQIEFALGRAIEQFEPWLEQDEDPRSMGWVDDKGRP
jgi:hypothetical protein